MEHEGVTDRRVLVIGLDAGCFPVLNPLFEAGVAPTLEMLFEDGVCGPLESQIPPWTASAWPSMYTGKNPGKHGVFDFLSFEGYDWSVVNATHVRERAIWELLSDHGISSVIVNVPVTHPARPFDGALIPGMTAPEDPDCHPAGILEDVKTACGGYRIYPQSGPEPDRSIEGYERTIELRGAAFRYLLERFEPEFGFVQFQLTDSVFHERPGDNRAIEAVYRAVDREVSEIIEAYEPGTVLVLSDHGMGPIEGREFRVNEFLRARGHLRAQSGGEGMPNWTREWENDLLGGTDPDEYKQSFLERVLNVAARAGITTQRVAGVLDSVGLKEPIGRHVPNDLIRAASEQVDFPESRAYMRSKSELGIRINLEGREPNGQVALAEYESVRSELIDDLSAVRTPRGDPIFESVEPRETYFHGPELENGPDVVLVPDRFDHAAVAGLEGDLFADPVEPWNHKRTGVFAVSGENVDRGELPSEATIFDVAPTICSLFDVPIDDAMDGEALPIVRATERRTYDSYDPEPIAPTNDTTVADRLSDLGYL